MTSFIVCCEKPCCLSDEKASSRFGPRFPVVLASASVWQLPHVFRKIAFPWLESPLVTRPTAPQPAASSATTARATGASRRFRTG
jgi:hypothetical protein